MADENQPSKVEVETYKAADGTEYSDPTSIKLAKELDATKARAEQVELEKAASELTNFGDYSPVVMCVLKHGTDEEKEALKGLNGHLAKFGEVMSTVQGSTEEPPEGETDWSQVQKAAAVWGKERGLEGQAALSAYLQTPEGANHLV